MKREGEGRVLRDGNAELWPAGHGVVLLGRRLEVCGADLGRLGVGVLGVEQGHGLHNLLSLEVTQRLAHGFGREGRRRRLQIRRCTQHQAHGYSHDSFRHVCEPSLGGQWGT